MDNSCKTLTGYISRDTVLTGHIDSRIVLNDYVIELVSTDTDKKIVVSRSGEAPQIMELHDGEKGAGITGMQMNPDFTLTIYYGDGSRFTTPEPIRGPQGDPGEPGEPGKPGVSPSASVSRTEDGAMLTVNDASGTTTALIKDGAPGTPGSDASVTADNIKHALGYTPANDAEQSSLKSALESLDGKAVKSVNNTLPDENGNVNISGGGAVNDVQVNGTSVLVDGVAIIPLAAEGAGIAGGNGMMRLRPSCGLEIGKPKDENYNSIAVVPASNAYIAKRVGRGIAGFGVVATSNLVYAFDSVLCSTAETEQLTAEQQAAAQQRLGLDWHTVTITEADFPVVSSGYSVYKIVPPNGYRFDEVQFLLQLARSTAGSAQAALNIGIHETITDSGYHSVNQNIAAANLFVQVGGRITCLSDYDFVFTGTAGSGTTVYTSLPQTTNIGSTLSRTLHAELRPSRTLSIGIGASFAIEHAYGVIKYRLVKAD